VQAFRDGHTFCVMGTLFVLVRDSLGW